MARQALWLMVNASIVWAALTAGWRTHERPLLLTMIGIAVVFMLLVIARLIGLLSAVVALV
jgi:hypothetical protein